MCRTLKKPVWTNPRERGAGKFDSKLKLLPEVHGQIVTRSKLVHILY